MAMKTKKCKMCGNDFKTDIDDRIYCGSCLRDITEERKMWDDALDTFRGAYKKPGSTYIHPHDIDPPGDVD